MIDFASIVTENPAGVFATQDGKAVRTRVLSAFLAEGNRLWFTTGTEKPLFAQLKNNPSASFCTHAENYRPVLSVSGKVSFVNDLKIKARFMEEYPSIKGHYQTPDSPTYQLFYLDATEVSVYLPGEGTKKYQID